jgi:signal transduction histidine kinase
MIDLQKLREMPLFTGLPEERWRWLCNNLAEVSTRAGEVLVSEGETSAGFFVLLAGEFVITKLSNGQQILVERRIAPTFFGGVSLLTGTLPLTTLKAETQSCGVRLSEPVFRELLMCCESFSKIIFRSVAARYIDLETLVHNQEKMAALGMLAAGLAHELNNPASAVARAADRARQALDLLHDSALAFSRSALPHEALSVLDALSRRNATGEFPQGALRQSEAEQMLSVWLARQGGESPWLMAPCLVASGITPDDLRPLAASLNPEQFNAGIRWLGATLELGSIMDEAKRGAARISDIVKAMKSYSYMDQAPQQEVDIHEGIEDTLTIMHHKLKQGVTVKRDYDRCLPRLTVYGSELNQVWTNIIDNAADAMSGRGDITVRTCRQGDYVVVEITDNGPGIPPEIQSRLFDPFFTTKPPGKGTGLGLDIAYRTVVNRHSGTIRVISRPGETTFQVCLPLLGNRKTPG